MKFARNRRFWNALAAEKPEHKKAEGFAKCFIVVVEFDEKDMLRGRDSVNLVAELKPEYRIKTVRVDGGQDDVSTWESPPVAQAHIADVNVLNGPENGSGSPIDMTAPGQEKKGATPVVIQFVAGDRGGRPIPRSRFRERKGDQGRYRPRAYRDVLSLRCQCWPPALIT